MTINYGKREAGSLTASSPGDTLYIPFASYNDSGDSEALTGLATSDIEIFKNGGVTPRATDSGYSLISDTGQYGDRVGLHRFSVQLFNTSDDTGFFDQGSQYHVAVDAVTIDGKTVRFFPAVFEIDRQKVNVEEIDGDTGAADRLGKLAETKLTDSGTFDTGSGRTKSDTGPIADGVWGALKASHADTGTFGEELGSGVNLVKIGGDTGAASRLLKFAGIKINDSGTMDTGTGIIDTGPIANAVWNALSADHVDTGSLGEALGQGVNLTELRGDTGAADRLLKFAGTKVNDSGTLDTGTGIVDTGPIANAVWNALAADHVDTGTLGEALGQGVNVTEIRGDTGAASIVASSFADTGFTLRANIEQINGDTGAAAHLGQAYDAQATQSDTGLIANTAAIRAQTDKLTFDTGANELHADVRKVNNVQVGGTGTNGDEWGPA